MGLFLRTTVQGKVKMKVKLQLGHKVKVNQVGRGERAGELQKQDAKIGMHLAWLGQQTHMWPQRGSA